MNDGLRELLDKANRSLSAAVNLQEDGYYDFAASRAYYAMFYMAEAMLLKNGLSFSKHSGVHAAFNLHFVKTGAVPVELHKYLVSGMELRHAGDYGAIGDVSKEASSRQISNAQEFLRFTEKYLS